ncbi:MAG TPA: hypothetical protein VIH81_07295 [Roseiarcus sp.]
MRQFLLVVSGWDRLSDGFDVRKDEVDAGKELLAVVVLRELGRQLTHERVLRAVELRPPERRSP